MNTTNYEHDPKVNFYPHAGAPLAAFYPQCPSDCEVHDGELVRRAAAEAWSLDEQRRQVADVVSGYVTQVELPVVGWFVMTEVDEDGVELRGWDATRVVAAVLVDETAEVVPADVGSVYGHVVDGLVEVRPAGSGVDLRRVARLHYDLHLFTQRWLQNNVRKHALRRPDDVGTS